MNDGYLLAIATVCAAAIAVGVPATITALSTRHLASQAIGHLKGLQATVDERGVEAREAAAGAADRAKVAAVAAQDAKQAAADAKRAAEQSASAIGEPNGDGPVTAMLATLLLHQQEIMEWQLQHGAEDVAAMTALTAEQAEVRSILAERTARFDRIDTRFDRIDTDIAENRRNIRHDVKNIITPIQGQVDMLWHQAGFPPFRTPKDEL